MSNTNILARDRMGKCRYVVSLTGTTLRVVMRGYGLEAFDTQEVKRRKGKKVHFNDYAHLLTDKMVTLERRMGALARLTTQLKANGITGVARTSSSVRHPSHKVNPLSKIKV